MKPLFLIILLSFFSSCAQNISTSKAYDTEIQFTEAWVWEYENESIAENESGHRGEMVVYFNREKNYWLFTSEAYGNTDEMADWILGKPGGAYISGYTDEFGDKKLLTDTIRSSTPKTLPEHYQPAGKQKEFNTGNPDFPVWTGDKYLLEFLKTNDTSIIYLAPSETDFSALYHFNGRDADARLPVCFPIDLPGKTMVLEEESFVSRQRIFYSFKEISHTVYYINLDDYK